MLRLAVTAFTCAAAFAQSGPGRPATDAEVKAKDLTIMPNGAGLPKGHGDAKQGQALNVNSTPTLYINERKYEGPFMQKYLEMWIDEELAVNR